MRFCFTLTFVVLSLLAGVATGQETLIDLSAEGARLHRAEGGRNLTGPSQDTPSQIVAGFLRSQGRSDLTVASLVTVTEGGESRTGLKHLRLEQEVAGLRVFGAYAKAAINNQGELVHMVEILATPSPAGPAPARINETVALQTVLNRYYPGLQADLVESGRDGNTVSYSHNGFFYQNPRVTRVAVPLVGGAMRIGFLVETWSGQQNLLHHTLVSGNGQILLAELRTNTDSYAIFPDHPGKTPQVVKPGPGAGNAESPSGWLSGAPTTVNIAGNNVHAYLDANADNAPDGGGSAVGGGDFLTTADLGQDPATSQNKAVAVQNLFYFNNLIHDKLYRHGFTESAGNFQENNFGNGGVGGDSVNAEAQDGSGTNNANFSTPSDGSSPRMQMYLWTITSPMRDGDVDSDIIYHEYGHGLTWRMIGSMSGPMSGAIGEGMSDVLSILMNDDDIVGEYSYNDAVNGIRSAPYTDYGRTYGNFGGSSVHFDGEIYAATIWKLWGLFQSQGISQDVLLDYLIDGMNYTPSRPAFENMRDGILASSPIQAHDCLVWDAFAAFGVGVGASGTVKGGGPFGGGKVSVTESFEVPAECAGPTQIAITSTPPLPDGTVNQPYSYVLEASGGEGARTWSISSGGVLPSGLNLNSSTGEIFGIPDTSESRTFTVEVSDLSYSDSKEFTLTVKSGPEPGAPDAPSNLGASAKRQLIMLSWTDNSTNEEKFVLQRSEDGGASWTSSWDLPPDSSNYKDSSVNGGITYTYRLKAENAFGSSAYLAAVATAK